MVYGIEHSSLGSEAIPDKGCHGLLRIADVWTGRGPPACTGQAQAVTSREFLNSSGVIQLE